MMSLGVWVTLCGLFIISFFSFLIAFSLGVTTSAIADTNFIFGYTIHFGGSFSAIMFKLHYSSFFLVQYCKANFIGHVRILCRAEADLRFLNLAIVRSGFEVKSGSNRNRIWHEPCRYTDILLIILSAGTVLNAS